MNARPSTATSRTTLPIVELRQYAMRPGQRDELIELFERHFLESQEALDMEVPGHFRDLDDPDRFVWLRGFADLATRLAGLTAFYSAPIWYAHREAANATMIDSDNVHLLGEARPGSGLSWRGGGGTGGDDRAARPELARAGQASDTRTLVEITTYALAAAADAPLIARFTEELEPLLSEHGGALLGVYQTLAVANDYPRLPVREGEWVLTTVARYAEASAHARAEAAIARSARWNERFAPLLAERQLLIERRRLQPAARSLMRDQRGGQAKRAPHI